MPKKAKRKSKGKKKISESSKKVLEVPLPLTSDKPVEYKARFGKNNIKEFLLEKARAQNSRMTQGLDHVIGDYMYIKKPFFPPR